MGQYFAPVIEKGRKMQTFAHEINGEFVPFKLTEHSWIRNDWVNRIAEELYHQPARVAWVGQYIDCYETDEEYPGNISLDKLHALNRFTNSERNLIRGLTSTDFNISDKFLINHDKKLYIDIQKYMQNNIMKDVWCIHPLPILTCFGNGFGGGDYNYPTDDSTFEYVGSWGWNLIEIVDEAPEGFSELNIIFKEKGWE